MDHLGMNPHLQISKDTKGPSMMDGDVNYIYGAWGPYTNSMERIVEFVKSHNIVGYKSICDDGNEGRWIIIQSINTAYIAQGPFTFDVDHMVMNEDSRIIGVTLGQDNQSVKIKGLGTPCFDFLGVGQFWVISKFHDLNEGQSFCAPPTIPFSCDSAAVEVGMDPTLSSHIPEVKGVVFQDLVEEDVDSRPFDIDALCEGGTNQKLVEQEPGHLVDFNGDGTNLGSTCGNEGLALLMPITYLEIGHGDYVPRLEQDGVHFHAGESQPFGPLPNDVDISFDDIYTMFGELVESDQAPKIGSHGWMDIVGDGVDCGATIVPTNLEAIGTRIEVVGNINGNGGLASIMPIHGDETLEDNHVQFERDRTHGHFGASHFELEGQKMAEETIVNIPNLEGNNEPTRKKPWMDEPPCFSLAEANNDMMEATPMFGPIVGDGVNGEVGTMPKIAQVAKPPSPRSVLRLNALKKAINTNEDHSLGITGTSSNGNEDMPPFVLGDLMETLEGDALQPLFDQGSSLPIESQWMTLLRNVEDFLKDGEMEGQVGGGTGSNGNEDMVASMLGDLMETLEGDALQPLLDQGTSLPTESQWMNPLGNDEEIYKDGEMEGQIVEGTVETTNTSSRGCKPSKKRPRESKFKHHGVKRREGGRESFVAYFRPKDLPESNKTFVTIGEFSNREHAWDAFNLFAFVHEGEESCINMVDRDSIEMDAAVWGELPRVDLLAHLRLKGRGYFRSDVLPSDSFIPRYRNIKFRKNTRGIDKGKIRWFCDIVLGEGVTDPYIGNGTKDTSTYETAEEAAKEADRLLMLNEGHMAWTNYTLTDYMTEVEKDQWDPTWIPLQDNPKKYLSTAKYSSLD